MGEAVARRGVIGGGAAWQLALISFLSLYIELTLIRWLPTQVRLLAYFSNYVLISALLGLGVGMLLRGRPTRFIMLFPPALFGVTALMLVLERRNVVLPIVSEDQFVWNYLGRLPAGGVLAYGLMIGIFLTIAALFALMGQEVGRALQPFAPIAAYSINIVGSLLGVVAFALISFLGVSPAVWFLVGAVGLGAYLVRAGERRLRPVALLSLALVVGVVYQDTTNAPDDTERRWSAYYEIDTSPLVSPAGQVWGYNIVVNKDSHQQALDLSDRFVADPFIASRQRLYNLPYTFGQPTRVLVVGAGTGNDVAAALRNAPTATVDAVEIDRVIADLGKELHPERPYASPNVNLHIDDARSFLQKSDTQYDLIVFGFLDSHRLFSNMSSVRMDNYVYTKQNFESVRDHLSPNGVVAVTFTVHEKWIADRIFTVMHEVFGQAPLVYQGNVHSWGTTLLAGPGAAAIPAGAPLIDHQTFSTQVITQDERITWKYTEVEGYITTTELSDDEVVLTDDWPYLYMKSRSIPANYLLVLLLTVGVALPLVWLIVPRISLRQSSNWNFFLLGAAFALLETKGITEIALVFGSTWLTNSIVISAILLMILLANLVAVRLPAVPLPWVYGALFAFLLFNYFVSLRALLDLGFGAQLIAAGLQVAGPLFFSGLIFAHWFRRTGDTSAALGANLMGAVVGGLLEYSSLLFGLRDLYLLALGFYALSFLVGTGRFALGRTTFQEAPAD